MNNQNLNNFTDMNLVVGLGNPGKLYENTWHNLGFLVINRLMNEMKCTDPRLMCQSTVVETTLKNRGIILAKPLTFMNRSGFAVKGLLDKFGIDPTEMIIIHDDVDLDFGVVRVKSGGGDGGHRGVRSIMDVLESGEFNRVRLGISRPPGTMETSDYVLSIIEDTISDQVDDMIQKSSLAIQTILLQGTITAMNRFNRREKAEIEKE